MIYLITILTVILASYLLYTFYKIVFLNNAPYINSSNKKIDLTIAEISKLTNLKTVYELGCGDAKFLRKLKKQKPELACLGLEYDLVPYLIAKFRNIFLKNKIEIKRADIFNYDLTKADLIYCYLNPKSMQTLQPIIAKLKNVVLISNTFSLPHTKSYKQIHFKNTSLFFYKIN